MAKETDLKVLRQAAIDAVRAYAEGLDYDATCWDAMSEDMEAIKEAGARMRRGYDAVKIVEAVDATPAPAPTTAEGEALGLALEILGRQEPGDSRAVSDEYVAMAAVQAGDRSPDLLDFIRDAKERVAALPPLPLPEITVTYGDAAQKAEG